MTASPARDYDDIPGTFVFDGRRARQGYPVNNMCMSLNDPANRERFRRSPEEYLDRFALSPEQRAAILNRDWLGLLELGGNIYFTFKLAIFDGLSMQDVGAAMSGVSTEEFKQMMREGGREWNG
jgi:protocatechuate 4,5-dioxygenase, alpha chain